MLTFTNEKEKTPLAAVLVPPMAAAGGTWRNKARIRLAEW